MATNASEHLGLHLWEPTDQVLRTEFNENWQKIDTAAAGLREDLTQGLEEVTETLATGGAIARIAWGTYTGTGTHGQDHPTSLTFDFFPVLVIVGCAEHANNTEWPTIMLRGVGICKGDNVTYPSALTWTDNGVVWWNYDSEEYQNNAVRTYYYAAVGVQQ